MAVALGLAVVEVGAGADDAVPAVAEGLVGLVLLLPLTGACKRPAHSPAPHPPTPRSRHLRCPNPLPAPCSRLLASSQVT